MENKTCFACQQSLPLSAFARDNTRHGVQRECRECCTTRKRAWHQTSSGQRSSANTKLKRRLGIDVEEFEFLSASVGNVCEICKKPEKGTCRLSVDHCHTQGYIRGLLCNNCNVGLGNFLNSPEALRQAAVYLDERGAT